MDEADLKRRVKGLEEMLAHDFGIHSRAELLEAIRHTEPIDISIFVDIPPWRANSCLDVTKTKNNTA